MKFKKLTKEQLLISIDRLTRFKPVSEKYFRVFSDIICSNLIEPAYKKQELLNKSAIEITQIAEEIINASIRQSNASSPLESDGIEEGLKNINSRLNDVKHSYKQSESQNKYSVNKIIKHCENSIFINDIETQYYLDNKIDYNLFIQFIDESCPINLRWLKLIIENADKIFTNPKLLAQLRLEKGLKFPIQKVLLVEGITEEILLPAFSKYLGFDFYREGIQIIAAGGKNQVVKMYYKLIEELKIPIFILLDNDAVDNINQIKPKLRDIDKIHLVSCGEFEDLLPKSLIIKTINNELSNFASISENDFDYSDSTVNNLENIFKTKGLHEFKKADFAKLVKDNISEDSDISVEIASIVVEIGL